MYKHDDVNKYLILVIVNTDDDGASGSMIRALANHHSSSQVDSAETAGRQNYTEPYRHRHSYTVTDTQRHRHTDRESCEGKDTCSYTDRPRNGPKETHIQRRNSQFIIDLIDMFVTLISTYSKQG